MRKGVLSWAYVRGSSTSPGWVCGSVPPNAAPAARSAASAVAAPRRNRVLRVLIVVLLEWCRSSWRTVGRRRRAVIGRAYPSSRPPVPIHLRSRRGRGRDVRRRARGKRDLRGRLPARGARAGCGEAARGSHLHRLSHRAARDARPPPRRRQDPEERRRPRHRRRPPHARARFVPPRRRPGDDRRPHEVPDGSWRRRGRARGGRRRRRSRHTKPRLPRRGRPGADDSRRRAAGAVVALPDSAPGRRLPLRRRYGTPEAPLLTHSAVARSTRNPRGASLSRHPCRTQQRLELAEDPDPAAALLERPHVMRSARERRIGGVTVTPDTTRWGALAAVRTRGDVGDGIASVLALLGRPDVISFAGGFPDPATFPRERIAALLQEFAADGELSAFQYAPTRGLAGPLDAFANRLERWQGRRPAEDELLITSGAIEALELVGKSYLDPGDAVVVEGPTYLGAIQSFRSFEATLVP